MSKKAKTKPKPKPVPKKKRIKKSIKTKLKHEKLCRGWWDPKTDIADFREIMKDMNEDEKYRFKKRVLKLIRNSKKPKPIQIME